MKILWSRILFEMLVSASEEIPHSLRKVHGDYHVQDIPPFVSFMSLTNQVLTLLSYFCNINFNIIILSTFMSYKSSL